MRVGTAHIYKVGVVDPEKEGVAVSAVDDGRVPIMLLGNTTHNTLALFKCHSNQISRAPPRLEMIHSNGCGKC